MDLLRKKPAECMTLGNLNRCLTAFDLILMGIGAIIGAGIFVITGVVAATHTGPAIIFSYLLAGAACAFSALSYAELASSLGGCGGAYGYAYAGFGELIAWIVGWDLLLEYAISVSAVSVAWSAYLNDIFLALKISLPKHWIQGPLQGGYIDLLSCSIILLLTILLMLGIQSSKRFNNIIVWIKLVVIALFIVIACKSVNPTNWSPFFPFGWSGVIKGSSLIFFAYIGFDAVATAAEEVIHPQRDLPRGILGSLLICTILYLLVSGLLTGIVPYTELNTASPVSHALILIGHRIAASFIAVGAIAGLTTVMLVLFYGLSRVFLAMARDGLLPQFFARINPKTRTPMHIIILCGSLIAISAALLPLNDLAEMVNIGTLFAFILVCGGVIILRHTQPNMIRPFKTPWMPIIPLLGMASCGYLIINLSWMTILRFLVWLVLGLIIYFSFGRRNSNLNTNN